jgi:putative ABC transport system substrate-binding protein
MTTKRFLVWFLIVVWPCFCGACSLLTAAAAGQPRTVAIITWRGDTPAELGFMEGLNSYGYDLRFIRYPANQEIKRLDAAIASLKKDRVDLIYIFGTTATKRVLQEIKETPVVFNIVTRPVESGIIASWDSSGNNATGVSSMVPIIHQLETLRKVIRFSTLGIIYNPLEQNSVIQRDIAKQLETLLDFTLYEFKITAGTDIPQILGRINTGVDAVYLPSDSMVKILGNDIMTVVNSLKIPSLSAMEDMVVKDSALMGLVPDYYQLGRLAAAKANLIIQGKHPSQIPTSTLDHFNIILNMNTAKQIGINIPTSILIMADRIIR